MDRLQELIKLKRELNAQKLALDDEASMQTTEGFMYTRMLTRIVLVQLEIEALQIEKAAH
ncbi:hypothetical protein [Paenibacillus sp. FSL H8-0034]|uniref:hypothetical protein n=1 Tax=Paenibacillus sp. FSL H8-0034 TaxID=2954671 RepID=UPI0030F82910